MSVWWLLGFEECVASIEEGPADPSLRPHTHLHTLGAHARQEAADHIAIPLLLDLDLERLEGRGGDPLEEKGDAAAHHHGLAGSGPGWIGQVATLWCAVQALLSPGPRINQPRPSRAPRRQQLWACLVLLLLPAARRRLLGVWVGGYANELSAWWLNRRKQAFTLRRLLPRTQPLAHSALAGCLRPGGPSDPTFGSASAQSRRPGRRAASRAPIRSDRSKRRTHTSQSRRERLASR